MITGMLIHNVEEEQGIWVAHYITRECLFGCTEYNENIEEGKFFMLACQYLEDICGVYSTDQAKVDYYDQK